MNRNQGLRAIALQQRIRTAGAPCPTEAGDCLPRGTTREEHRLRSVRPRRWYVVSSLSPGMIEQSFGGVFTFPTGVVFEVPTDMCLWSLGVDYPDEDGQVQIGDNNPAIPVRAGVLFNLDTTEFPCELCGPLKVYILRAAGAEPPVLPNWYAIIAEASE